ncbi:MAG: WecB/TagA/CpsF family glycosyltransferase [Clostridia bacterium]|nr:WecB/TagA/CpsF family glycosyltransferase [Clostridia bacterium]
MLGRGAGGRAVAAEAVDILGVRVDVVDLTQAADAVERLLADGGAHLVVTPNPEIIVAARRDHRLRDAVASADLAPADGVGVVWAARLLGRPLPGRVPGVDLMFELLRRANRRGYRVFLLGTRPDVLERAAAEVRRRFPGAVLAGFHHGYFGPAEEAGVIAQVAAAKPDLLFSGMGAPRDQVWLAAHLHRLGARVAVGVGGSLDVLAGTVRRAPGWMQAAGLEWLFRLLQEPWRARRMRALPVFAVLVLGQAFRRRARRGGHTARGS